MLKIYSFNGAMYQFEEGQQPRGAAEVALVDIRSKEAEVEDKTAKKRRRKKAAADVD